ncbi:AtpZ/AtpI family protein [Leptospira kanakyensis]|uniref:AtpZ/AtpI family protein n=2 Tax=Leptospira kanakyensis TaxID=2484968 RepID=A0A6N4Q8C3_9LEPT|nr:AtpZ/AtpI family protein [Leptospira kanakyensis]MCW7469944.1 AtpZ/AtpI family protein [Leptospira kanakyensis]MCW7480927.1 AtpZ/AtpI family protein [Leptospira kanakyensis]TGK48006.1 AtpZ/AtpI family protein [Leptospira kanakyensis]TGK64350.1 AtpZ/AtpI family protein [Leptospira kanakyensis]TGK67225.1 AtpZ/AtpI family protein [Leptospira kanakyensis]
MTNESEKPSAKKPEKSPMAMAGAGFEFVSSIALFVVGGYYLDEYLKTEPLWLLIGFFLGFVLAFYSLIKRAKENE